MNMDNMDILRTCFACRKDDSCPRANWGGFGKMENNEEEKCKVPLCTLFYLILYFILQRRYAVKSIPRSVAKSEKNFFFTHACKTLICEPFKNNKNGSFPHSCVK